MELSPKTVIYGISALGTVASLFAGGGIDLEGMDNARNENFRAATNTANLERSEKQRLRQQEIANARYENCELFVHGSHQTKLTLPSLSEELTITDRTTGKPFPRGTVVCDANGNTGIIGDKGKPQYMAFTGDRDLIQKRVKRFRGGIYSQPVAGN